MKNVRTNVVLPGELLEEIDRVAGQRRRSSFLAEAAREKLARLRFDDAAARAFGAWKDANHPELTTEADLELYLRNIRKETNLRIRKRLTNE